VRFKLEAYGSSPRKKKIDADGIVRPFAVCVRRRGFVKFWVSGGISKPKH
jgi:hypothetical protein